MTGIGYFPIAVALLGLVVLYSLYTYNQIKPLKAALTKVIDDMADVSRKRKMLIINYDQQNGDGFMSTAASELKKTSTDRFQSYKKEESLLAVTTEAAENVPDEGIKKEIMDLNGRQRELIKKLENASNRYNRFISKAPAKTVASIFGFRPF